MAQCPCGSGADLADCCGPIVSGDKAAPTAEALMRSRYTAFVQGALDHIDRSWARDKREAAGRPTADDTAESVEWVGLEILGASRGGADDDTGTVEFAASFRQDGKLRIHRERSRFRREDGRWVYVDGDIAPDSGPETNSGRAAKTGRNQPCPCGSGKKFKKCCGA